MDNKDLKKILAGVTITALLAGTSLTFAGCSTNKSSCSGGTGSCNGTKTEGSKSGCGGGSSCSGH